MNYYIPFIVLTNFVLNNNVVIGSKPILFSDNPSALPVTNFDFVFIPKEVVRSHLPAFEQNKLRLQANQISKRFNLTVPKYNDTAMHLNIVEWYKRRQISEKDPDGQRRKALKRELCQLTTQLDPIVSLRKNLIMDIQRLQASIQRSCSTTSNSRLSDSQFIECRVMKEHLELQSTQLMKMNENEKKILQRMRDIRRQIALF